MTGPHSEDDVVATYLRYLDSKASEDFWAWDYVHMLSGDEPIAALRMVTRLVEEVSSDQVGSLGAGPVEDVVREADRMVASGDASVLDQLVEVARGSARMREALTHVWPRRDDQRQTWDRLDGVLGTDVRERHPESALAEDAARDHENGRPEAEPS